MNTMGNDACVRHKTKPSYLKRASLLLLGVVAIHDMRAEAFTGISPTFRVNSCPKLVKYTARRPNEMTILSVLPPEEYEHAREIFNLIDADNSGTICVSELGDLLTKLGIEVTPPEAQALFTFLDKDESGGISFEDEFQPWYDSILESTLENRDIVQEALLGRRTVNNFDADLHVSDHVLNRAIECATAAPNHKLTEPWRFIKLGKETVTKIATLNAQKIQDPEKAKKKRERWEKIPGWCVVTSKLSPDARDGDSNVLEMEDYAATCCAVQNFMLSMWVEGVGTKWTSGDITRTQEFADLCGIQMVDEQVVGCIWYGFASTTGGKNEPPQKNRKKTLKDVLTELP